MRTTKQSSSPRLLIVLLIAIIGQGCVSSPQRSFSSPDEAVNTLVTALRAHDRTQMDQLFGRDAEELLSSGDEVADRQTADNFLEAYDQKHQLVPDDNGDVTLVIGNRDWPLPIPLIKDSKTGGWKFDTAAGIDEIYNRRIGRNELTVIQVCKAIVDAELEYAQRDPNNDGVPEYAMKFLSDPGQKNGLYWETAEAEPASPLGPFVAEAEAQGYSAADRARSGEPRPYQGYLYRILMSQGEHAPGGKLDYIISGKLIGGFAVVAWPAIYGNSGVMTFLADYRGQVYQKDLGRSTADAARKMTAFDPGPGWQLVEDRQ